MFDHVKFGSQRLCSEQSLLPEGTRTARRSVCRGGGLRPTESSYARRVTLHCACSRPRKSRRIFTWRSRPRHAGKSTLSIARRWRRVPQTMVRPACARSTTRTTMQLSSSDRTGTTSKRFATNPRPDPSIGGRLQAGSPTRETRPELARSSSGSTRWPRHGASTGRTSSATTHASASTSASGLALNRPIAPQQMSGYPM